MELTMTDLERALSDLANESWDVLAALAGSMDPADIKDAETLRQAAQAVKRIPAEKTDTELTRRGRILAGAAVRWLNRGETLFTRVGKPDPARLYWDFRNASRNYEIERIAP
jgi:hypothetical protein